MSSKQAILSRRQIEGLIADGRSILIIDGKVVKADAWLKYHPGGDKAIKHMIGRDATDEVNAYGSLLSYSAIYAWTKWLCFRLHSPEARQRMNTFQIGRIQGRWQNFLPPIQGGKFRSLNEPGSAGVEKCDTSLGDDRSVSSEASNTPSPVFEPRERVYGVRRRRNDSNVASSTRSSSATSLSSLNLDSSEQRASDSPMQARTREELESDLAKFPPLDHAVQDDIVQRYRLLNERIRREGLYNCDYRAYAIECCRYTLFFAVSMILLHWGWYISSSIFLGIFWHQLAFTAHDAGHMGITHGFQTDTVIGIVIADFLGGLSIGWWKRNHNVHHIVTNSPEHDPDIEHMPMFAISHRFFDSLRSTYYDKVMSYDSVAKFMLKYQSYLYYPLLCFGRFNLYFRSLEYLILGLGPRKGPAWWHRWLEIAGQVFFWTWFGYGVLYRSIPSGWDRFAFLMVSHMVTMPLHVQITLSHFAMSTSDLGVDECFPQKMLRTTMDVDCPQWLDFVHGGLQFQVIHHLYPRIPRHNLRRTQRLVQEFCKEVGIPYALYGFADGNKEVIGRLADVSRQARVLAECQKAAAKDMVEHL